MAEITGRVQILEPVSGANVQLGAGLTYPHPLGAQSLTTRVVQSITINNPISNGGDVTIARETPAGTAVKTLSPGQGETIGGEHGREQLRLGEFYITTVGVEAAEVSYLLR